ncbi:protein FAR-RED IMPAIRED RESPONSE 1-like [Telopea speciosissima]|uniref:protein FAR-RED IMPAIRED RESPONSE 1-like n=1 Tax=Telopea speciosissima TaxID=54955 RepID=UPI001CC65BF8|nr:protein FAR-RED IMPAIRED RESPONSE 1-like [Telopea speciosissima]
MGDSLPECRLNEMEGNELDGSEVYGEDEVGVNSPAMNFVFTQDDANLEPFVGMEFKSMEQAYFFYNEYARSIGFGTLKKNTRQSSWNGEFVDANFACTRSGRKRKSTGVRKDRPCHKTNCMAGIHVKRKENGQWVLVGFIKEHNHNLVPANTQYFRSHKKIDPITKNNIGILQASGVQTNNFFALLSKQCISCQNVSCLEKDFRIQIDKDKRLPIDTEDAQVLLEQFICMQEENPSFFYAIDLNDEQRLRNVFWVDAKSRHDYINFGDVVCFDTTYVTNKYKIPFAPFIGVNNHFQSTLLGCALIADESTTTFIWLMRTWLRAMGGIAPKVIITDQDKGMKAAIEEVFPIVHHRHCLWHILGKIPEKLGLVTKRHTDFMTEFNKCIYRSWKEEEFESEWEQLLNTFQLRDDEWLKSLYDDRRHWVPAYIRDTFFAGMVTASRPESVISVFDKYVQKNTTLKEFVDQYKVTLQNMYKDETDADFSTWHGTPALRSHSPYEKQMSKICTHEIFKKFQLEVMGIIACHIRKEKEDGATTTFRVQDFEVQEEFRVDWDEKNQRHAMVVFHHAAVPEIPSHYILKRRTVDAKSNYFTGRRTIEVQSKEQRYNDLCQRALIFFEYGSLSHESYNVAICALEEATNECLAVNNSIKEATKPHESGGAKKALKGGADKKRKRDNANQKSNEQLSTSLAIYDGCDQTQQRMEEQESALGGQDRVTLAASHHVQQRMEVDTVVAR